MNLTSTTCYYSHSLATKDNPHGKTITKLKKTMVCPICYYIEGASNISTHKTCLKPDGTENPRIVKLSCRVPKSSAKTMRCAILKGIVSYKDEATSECTHHIS